MKAYRGVDARILAFLTPVLVGEMAASGFGRFTDGDIFPYV
jgi:hypothetical protein